MKFVLLLCVALASSAYAVDDALTQDLMDFVELIPQDKLMEIAENYADDPELQEIYEYLMTSDEFKEILLGMESIPEYMEFLVYLEESGLDIFNLIAGIHEVIGLPPPTFPEGVVKSAQLRGVINDLTNEIRAILPKDAIKALHEEKLVSSSAFSFFVSRLTSQDAIDLVFALYSNAEFQGYLNTLLNKGIDVMDVSEMFAEIIGLVGFVRK